MHEHVFKTKFQLEQWRFSHKVYIKTYETAKNLIAIVTVTWQVHLMLQNVLENFWTYLF